MSDQYFVFRHSFTVISDLFDYELDDIFSPSNKFDLDHELLGSQCLYKEEIVDIGFKRGYLVIDEDIDPANLPTSNVMSRIKFPIAEYHYTVHHDTFRNINETYNKIEKELKDENLKAIKHPILVFPRGVPGSIEERTIIEIWTPTNADIEADERRSEKVKIALPRKRYNFYTW